MSYRKENLIKYAGESERRRVRRLEDLEAMDILARESLFDYEANHITELHIRRDQKAFGIFAGELYTVKKVIDSLRTVTEDTVAAPAYVRINRPLLVPDMLQELGQTDQSVDLHAVALGRERGILKVLDLFDSYNAHDAPLLPYPKLAVARQLYPLELGSNGELKTHGKTTIEGITFYHRFKFGAQANTKPFFLGFEIKPL